MKIQEHYQYQKINKLKLIAIHLKKRKMFMK